MPNTYDNMPSDRWAQYMQNAQETVNEAVNPVFKELGESAVEDAEVILEVDATNNVADEAQQFLGAVSDINEIGKSTGAENLQPHEGAGLTKYWTGLAFDQKASENNALKYKYTDFQLGLLKDNPNKPQSLGYDDQPPQTPDKPPAAEA